jgi:uncharacterized membrane protein YqaE (UPF0057 family)
MSAKADPETKTISFLRIITAIFLPPFGVFLKDGFGPRFWLNILLTLTGYVPGILHSMWVISSG